MYKIKIFDKYIFKQVLSATLVCLLLFVIIWIAPETLFKVIQRTLRGIYTVPVAFQLLLYEIPKILNKALPVGIFLGTLFTFDKLSKDSELTIFRSVGFSFIRIITPVMVLSLLISGICFFVNDKIGPFSCNKLLELKNDNPSSHFVYSIKDTKERPSKILIFPSYSKFNFGGKIVIMNFSSTHYSDASILKEIITSDSSVVLKDKVLITEGKKYTITVNGIYEKVQNIKKITILTPEQASRVHTLLTYNLKRDRELSNSQLHSYIKILKEEKLDDNYREMLNKYLQRYFHSFMCFLFGVLGCILGFSQPREQRLIGFTAAIIIIFAYFITLPCIDTLAEKNVLHPVIAATIHPLLLLMTTFVAKRIKGI